MLGQMLAQRIADKADGSHAERLFAAGPNRIAQTVGDERLEVALAAVTREDPGLLSECADPLNHLVVPLKSRNLSLADALRELESRHGARP